MTLDGKNLTPQQVCSRIQTIRNMQRLRDPKFNEYHETIYDDGIWKIDIEIFGISGVIRWWISREDKAGNYNNSLFTMYQRDNGEIAYSADYQIKKSIVERMIATYKLMLKLGIKDC